MTISILQSFLDNQFIRLEDDADHEKLKKAVEDLKKKWGKDKKKIIRATMVALDPDVDSADSLVQEVQAAIIQKWATFINSSTRTKDTPLTYIRSVILEVLQRLAASDIDYAALIFYSGQNTIRYYRLDREAPVLRTFIGDLSSLVEKAAQKLWQDMGTVDLPPFNHPPAQKITDLSEVNKDELNTILLDASLYSGWGRGGKNPGAPNNGHQWAEFFSKTAAEGLAMQLNKVLANPQKYNAQTEAQLKAYFAVLPSYFKQVSESLEQSYWALNFRNKLLWWKAALYSSKLSTSYRSLPPIVAAGAMAADLCTEVPELHPISVDYFLRETLHDVLGVQASKPQPLNVLLTEIKAHRAPFLKLLPAMDLLPARFPLIAFIRNYLDDALPLDQLSVTTGIAANAEVSLSDLSVWCLHDLQANHLSTVK
ncbi:GTPase-associated system all-helical protein GASH [Chitinophaga sp. 22620]|uniref:GTPase-associated system all-helical protein GASH n=1 Tax=Chitinophaga sp. 22620 TaxID=3453952 RepID=UPI003F82C134